MPKASEERKKREETELRRQKGKGEEGWEGGREGGSLREEGGRRFMTVLICESSLWHQLGGWAARARTLPTLPILIEILILGGTLRECRVQYKRMLQKSFIARNLRSLPQNICPSQGGA